MDYTSAAFIQETIWYWEMAGKFKIKGDDAMNKHQIYDAFVMQVLPFAIMEIRSFLSRYNMAILNGPTREELEGMKLNRSSAKWEPQFVSMEQGMKIMRLNRSLANLKLQQYEEALADTEYHEPGVRLEKQLYRASLALYHLQRFDESYSVLADLVRQFPGNVPAAKQFSAVKERLRERNHGQYIFDNMYEVIMSYGKKSFDFASYTGPLAIKGKKGHGIFTTKAVEAGELLLCEKAFCFCDGYVSRLCLDYFMYVNNVWFRLKRETSRTNCKKSFTERQH